MCNSTLRRRDVAQCFTEVSGTAGGWPCFPPEKNDRIQNPILYTRVLRILEYIIYFIEVSIAIFLATCLVAVARAKYSFDTNTIYVQYPINS
jgi:hypothetical protein